ncbi:MAG: DUF4304 domain-containing protein [Cyanobacteria bacterium SZAS LIN-3]|nr:DUF4304 domain-containing protein [Cyanobacteria bacterium SZAS LIN-3]
MADRKCMHAALKKIIVPDLRARGFKGRYPHFRRIAATHTDLLNFQFDKYHRDLFVINITQAPGSGMYTTRLGDQFHRDNLKYFQVTESTYRLQPKSIGGADDWFAYAQENYDEIARSILPYIKRADQWFADTSDTEGLARSWSPKFRPLAK